MSTRRLIALAPRSGAMIRTSTLLSPSRHVTHLRSAPIRCISGTPRRLNVPTWPNPPMPQPPVGPSDNLASGPTQNQRQKQKSQSDRSWYSDWAHSPSFQAALTTVVGLGMVFGAGIGYLDWYKAHVLRRIEKAFAPGYVRFTRPSLTLTWWQRGGIADHVLNYPQGWSH